MFTTIYDKPGYDDYLELEPLGADTAGDQRLTSLDIHKSQRFCREQRYVPWFWSIPIVCNSCWTLPCGNFRIAMENWMLFGCFTYPKMSLCIVHFYIYNYLYTFIYIYLLHCQTDFLSYRISIWQLEESKKAKGAQAESSLKRSCRG